MMNLLWISIDSLNRHFLKAYGQPIELDVKTPNLDAFARKAAVFDAHYAGSLPCMPARREFWTGIQEFLWRPWGPIEPYDRPLARLARERGIVSQLITDHYHFIQHGSHGYAEDFVGFELIRGHEIDAWKTAPHRLDPESLRRVGAMPGADRVWGFMNRAQYLRNVDGFKRESDFFAPKVFAAAADWIEENRGGDPWFLLIDSFDVHEPFHVPEPYASMYTDEDPNDPDLVIWPLYGRIDQGPSALTERQVAFVRSQFAAKLTMVDRWLGRVFERLDDFNLWESTVVIVSTDHGHFLGEHGWMGKPACPPYNVLVHTPLLIWHPQGACNGRRIGALTSAVDLYATGAEVLGITDVHPAGHSRSLVPLLMGETESHREWAIYGYWGRAVGVTDGRHTYLRAPVAGNEPLFAYSTMMIQPTRWFDPPQMQPDAGVGSLPYAEGPVWRIPATAPYEQPESLLFDVLADPRQERPITDPELAAPMRDLLAAALTELDAPEEQWRRLGL